MKPFDNKLESPFIMSPSRFSGIAFDLTELRMYYKCDEASGNLVNSAGTIGSTEVVSGENLTVSGATYQATGTGNMTYGISFDGTNDYANGNTASNWTWLNDQHDHTINFWYKPSGTLLNGQGIMATADSGATNGFIFDWRTTGDLRFITEKASSPTGNTNWSTGLSAGTWYMITHIHDDSANTFQMYVDGSVVSAAHSATVPTANTPDYPMYWMDTIYTGAAGGVLTNVSYWGRAWTSEEITSQYNGGNGVVM